MLRIRVFERDGKGMQLCGHFTGALTGSLKIPVVTSLPCQVTSFGNPTFTDKIFMIL